MSRLREPEYEPTRRAQLYDELVTRARGWLRDWRPREEDPDFATALLEIAARLEAEVTQRLKKIPEKTFRGFLDWLGVRGQAARAARLPLVFSMAPNSEPVLAEAPVQVQASGVDPAVTFETDQPLRIFPGRLAALVGVDPAKDRMYLPASGFSSLEAPPSGPAEWLVKAPASAGDTQVQLEPELGLDTLPTLLHRPTQLQYRVTQTEGGLVTIDPPVGTPEPGAGATSTGHSAGLNQGDRLERVPLFDPFGPSERNRQEHILYIGAKDLLNLPATARIQLGGVAIAGLEASWSYWGKATGQEAPAWQSLPSPTVVGARLVLEKPAGTVDETTVLGKNSRWLRAVGVSGAQPKTVEVSELGLSVNCDPGAKRPACALKPGDKRSDVAVEGIANTTPLVLDSAFYPLGREPRLFDAFYLGCPEAFSKKNAAVDICFQAANGASSSWAAATVGSTDTTVLFGIGADSQLYRIRPTPHATPPFVRLPAVRPPFAENGTLSLVASPASINRPQRLTVVARQSDTVVAMTAGADAWLWSEAAESARSRWFQLGPIVDPGTKTIPTFDPASPPEIVLLRKDPGLYAYALRQGILYEKAIDANLSSPAQPWALTNQGDLAGRKWLHIAPVFNTSRTGGAGFEDGLVAVDAAGSVGLFDPARGWIDLAKLDLVDPAVLPLAIRVGTGERLLFVQRAPDTVVMWRGNGTKWSDTKVEGIAVRGSFAWWATATGEPAIVLTTSDDELATWLPLATGVIDPVRIYPSAPLGIDASAPAVVDLRVPGSGVRELGIVVSGSQAEMLHVHWDPNGLERVQLKRDALTDVFLVPNVSQPYTVDDFVHAVRVSGKPVVRKIADVVPLDASRNVVRTDARLGRTKLEGEIHVHRRRAGAVERTGTVTAADSLTLENTDTSAQNGDLIVVSTTPRRRWLARVKHITKPATGPWVAEVEVEGDTLPTGSVKYTYVLAGEPHPLAVHPFLDLSALPAAVAAALKDRAVFHSTAQPFRQHVLHVAAAPPHGPPFALLEAAWAKHPTAKAGMFDFLLDRMYLASALAADTKSATAALSWEYWDGTAWWTIKNLVDRTGSLLATGAVSFCVPEGLQPTDVAGRTSHWIRARLVRGDYGQEKVTVTTVTKSTTTTTQTVDRSLEGVTPPQLVSVDLRYSVCCEVAPDLVITKDGGVVRDQSEANRVGATVELFMPLTETIRRATGAAAPDAGDKGAGDRAIYLGFDAAIDEGPISILFLVEEGQHDAAYPLQLDALRANGFTQVVVEDGTRGLNESGVLAFNLDAAPLSTSLFGETAPYWLRLRPKDGFDPAGWQPRIRGAYLNAAFAYAAETQDLERLGSSDGSPKQRVTLARPPVLDGSLELRIREPLGDEEVAELQRSDPTAVRDEVDGLKGWWVRWSPVDDTDDAAKDERVYAIDYESGDITFGDGLRGKVPPIGRDSIIAVRYKRGGGEAANGVAAWSQLNLITPVQGVQTVAAPGGAGGGSGPQTAEEVVRFGPANQHMRGRVLTLRDLEMLTLQSGRDVAQARALPGAGGVRLVVVMRGRDPAPPQEFQRALLRSIGERALPTLSARGGLAIVAPTAVKIRVALVLTIAEIRDSGPVAKEAKRRLVQLLDPATGGLDGTGWPLGEVPTETDIAATLDGIERLEEIDGVEVRRVGDDGALVAMPPLAPTQLVTLAPDGVRIRFETSTAGAPA